MPVSSSCVYCSSSELIQLSSEPICKICFEYLQTTEQLAAAETISPVTISPETIIASDPTYKQIKSSSLDPELDLLLNSPTMPKIALLSPHLYKLYGNLLPGFYHHEVEIKPSSANFVHIPRYERYCTVCSKSETIAKVIWYKGLDGGYDCMQCYQKRKRSGPLDLSKSRRGRKPKFSGSERAVDLAKASTIKVAEKKVSISLPSTKTETTSSSLSETAPESSIEADAKENFSTALSSTVDVLPAPMFKIKLKIPVEYQSSAIADEIKQNSISKGIEL